MDEQQINQNMLPEPKKSFWKSLWFKVLVAVVLIAILGFGVALASRIWDPLWNPFRPNPEKVLLKTLQNMESLQSQHVEADFRMDSKGKATNTLFLGVKDDTQAQGLKSKGTLSIALASEGLQVTADLSYISINGNTYFKIDKIPSIPFLPVNLNGLAGKWINLSKSNFGQAENIANLVQGGSDMVYFKSELPDENVNGKSAYHYIVGLKKEKVKELLNNLTTNVTSPEESYEAKADEIAEKISQIDIEYWIGKRDNLLYKSKVAAAFIYQNTNAVISGEVRLSDFNKPVDVQEPKDAVDISEILKTINLPGTVK